MHTSNFARSASHPKAVAISRTSSAAGPVARTSRSPLLRLLAAAKSGAIDEDEYTRRYRAEVPFRPTPPPSMSSRLCRLGEDAILLCWENSGVFCHRRLVAEWFEEELGVSVPEVGVGSGGERQSRLDKF